MMNKILNLLRFLFIVISFATYTTAQSINLKPGESCASVCSGKEKIFKFEEDKIYVYNFISKHSIKNPNAEKETLQLELKGNAEISKLSACDFAIQLSDINLKEFLIGKDGMAKEYSMMKTLLEKHTLRFGFDDGRVTGICQNKEDSEFAINVKKAIISSLQVSLDNLDVPNYLTETDISGDCITEYSSTPEAPNFVIVKKIKSTSGCSRKNKYFSSITGRVFEQPMENRHLALLDGSQSCEIKIKRSEGLKESICSEVQSYKSYFTNKEGSSIAIKQELRFDSIKKGKLSAQTPFTRTDLTMNHGDQVPLFMKMKQTPVLDVAKQLCIAIKQNSINIERTELFVKLIRSLHDSDYKGIQELTKYFNENSECSSNKLKLNNILLDALPYVKTDDAFKFLIEDSNVYQFQKLSFTTLENASPYMIGLFTKKLQSSKVENSALLTLSSMIKSFCLKTPGCTFNPDIINAMNFLVKNLGTNCYSDNSAAQEKILFTLRAIANAGNFHDYKQLTKILESCVNSVFNEDDVKVFAVEAVQQFPCHAEIDNFLWKIYDDISFSAEIKIQSYLSLIRCPMRETFRKIVQKLNTEKSQQLGSFVWSHITNLMETTDRFKIDLRDTLQIFTQPMNMLSRKFNLDFRSYSKNIEKTFQRGYSALKVDSNIVFSSSPIPSSVKTNLTIDVFGRSVNILEVGIRSRGVAEKLFSTINPIPHENTHSDIISMDKKNKNKLEKLSLSMYSKVMGHEIFYSPNLLSDVSMALLKPNSKKSFEKSLLLLDTVISVSSITGFPVQLAIESAVTTELQLSKNDMIQYNDIELSTKNYVAIQVIGKLQLNAHCTKIGVQSFATAVTDTEFGGKLKLINSKAQNDDILLTDYQFEINKMPDNKKLLSISNELSLIHNLKKEEGKPIYNILFEKCTGKSMLELRGVKICGLVSSAPRYQSYFPNLKAELNINKFNGFKFQLMKENVQKPINKLINFLILTSFQGGDKETIKYQFKQNIKEKTKMYEFSMWDKDIHLKLDIDKEKMTGKIKYGKREASLTGSISSKGIFSSVVDMNIKTENDEIILNFTQSFDKGLQLILNGYNKMDKTFNLQSKTAMILTPHKVFNYFERFRHDTNLKMPGDHEFSLILERSIGNNPTIERKGKVETYWKTKSKNKFNIKQNYLWSKYSVEDQSLSSDKIPGINYTITMDQQIEVNEKKFNMKHSLNYFLSNNFFNFGTTPSLVAFKLETFDAIKSAYVRQIDSKLFLDIMNPGKGQIYLKNLIKSSLLNFNQNLKVNTVWKKNSLDMYDINAEIMESEYLKILFNHKFTTTQNGVTSIEINANEKIYKINSELMLPKSHILTITWPENSLIIESKVDAKSIFPFNTVVDHDIKLGGKLLATVTNTAEYNSEKRQFSFQSVGKTNEKMIYSTKLAGQLKSNIESKKINIDFTTKFDVKIPSQNIDFIVETKQFVDIVLDGQINIKGKNFQIKFVYLNNKNNMIYGFETSTESVQSSDPYFQNENIIYRGSSADKFTLKFGKGNKKYLFGLNIDSNNILTEILYKFSFDTGKITYSSMIAFDFKTNAKYSFYYKNQAVIVYKENNQYSLTWNGEYGKSSKEKVPFEGSIKYFSTSFNKFDFLFDMSHPLFSYFKLSKVTFGTTFESTKKEDKTILFSSSVLVKWQIEGARTAKYYELKTKGNFSINMDNNLSTNFEMFLTKDSSLQKLLELESYLKINQKSVDSNIKFKYDTKNATLVFIINVSDPKNYISVFSIKTSSMILQELTLSSELKNLGTTYQGKSNFNLISKNSYNIEIKEVIKLDLTNGLDMVCNVKWESNLSYLNSGSCVFGILASKNNNFQVNFSLNYKNAKALNMKVSANISSYELQILAESFIMVPLKFSLKISSPSTNTVNVNSEIGYGENYLKISDTKMTWKREEIIKSYSFTMTILSSSDAFNDLLISMDTYYESNKVFTTYKSNSLVKYKDKTIQLCKIDLSTGEIQYESKLGQYLKNWKFTNVQLNINYKCKSIRDLMFRSSFLAEPIFTKVQFDFIYFRKEKDEKPKIIELLGEATFFNRIEFNYKETSIKSSIFIDKNVKSGTIALKVIVPFYSVKIEEVALTVEVQKESDNSYSGQISSKINKYKFKFETFGIWKNYLNIEGLSSGAYFNKASISYDFRDNTFFMINIDKKFSLDLNMKLESQGKRKGKINFIWSDKEVLNLQISNELKVPKSVATITDYLNAILGITKGMYLKYDINGMILQKPIQRTVEIYHVDSKQFPGGTKSFIFTETEMKSPTSNTVKFKLSFDRNYPMFDIEEQGYLKIDDDVKLDYEGKVKFISKNDFMGSFTENISNKFKIDFLVLYNSNIVQTNFNVEQLSRRLIGLGFRYLMSNKDLALYYSNSLNNYTMNTNLGNLIKNNKDEEYFPVGTQYFIKFSENYEMRIFRKKNMEFDVTLNYNWIKPVKMNVIIIKEQEGNKVGMELTGSSSFENMKEIIFKLLLENGNKNKVLTSVLRINRKLISDLKLIYRNLEDDKSHDLMINFKGNYNVNGNMTIYRKINTFEYSINVQDGNFKTELWRSSSKCRIKPEVNCHLIYKNQVREMIIRTIWEAKLKTLELTWHKSKGQSLIFSMEEKDGGRVFSFDNPIKKIKVLYSKSEMNNKLTRNFRIDLKAVEKTSNKDVFINLIYTIEGSLKSDYKLNLNLETSLMQKAIKVSLRRDVSVDIGDLYSMELKAFFGDEKSPFFGIKGYLRQLSVRSYEIKIHSTSYEKYAIMSLITIFANEEITIEYKLEQSNQATNEFLFQLVPFRKLHITNKKNIKILISRDVYQYGYRSDYALKLGSSGLDVVAYATYSKSPLKYYAELKHSNEKIVIHLRYVGDSIIGELYRKIGEVKKMDASLKMNINEKNILTEKINWDPKMIERMKDTCSVIFNPENMKNMMAELYKNSENQFSTYMSYIKADVIKNINVQESLDFLKGIANDWEKFPKSFTSSYENDDYYMKTIMTTLSDCFVKLDIPVKFYILQKSVGELKDAVSNKLYDWFIDAKLYNALYQPVKENLSSFDYEDIKSWIINIVNIGKKIFVISKDAVENIGNVLDTISKKAESSFQYSQTIKEAISSFYRNSMIGNIMSMLSDIKKDVINTIENIMTSNILKQRIQYYEDALKNSEEIITLLQNFKNKTLGYFQNSEFVTNVIQTIQLIRSLKYKEAFLNMIRLDEASFKMNLDEGSMEIQFYVPPISRSYLKIVKTMTNWLPIQALYKIQQRSLADKLLELFYRYEYLVFNYGSFSRNSLKTIFPPFAKSAWVINGFSLVTFDDSSIRIGSGKCSYLLARDFKKRSFSLVMKINSDSNTKEFVLSYIKEITILQSGSVKVDNELAKIFPKLIKKGNRNIIIHSDSDTTRIKTSEGLVIKYFKNFDALKVMVTGNWHGYIRGLLGSNDFDKINDWSLPNGHITHDAGTLSKSWSLGTCDGKTKTGFYTIKVQPSQLQECANLFQPESSSYLQRCYSLINPEPYLELCQRSLQYAPKSKEEFQDLLCSLSRNYVIRCKYKGIMIRLEKKCVKCGKNKLNSKISTNNLMVKKKFNFIFIMEQSTYLLPYRKFIENIADMMALNSENIFTLLSYNGQDVFSEVHFKSLDDKITANGKGFKVLLDAFWSSEQLSNITKNKKTDQPGKGIYDAIKMSSVPGYTEKIILVSHSACVENQKYIYSLLAGLLNNAGISVTYLTTQSLTGTAVNSGTVGLGNNLVYFFEENLDNLKSSHWRKDVQAPKDSCSPLARLQQGFVWSLKPLTSEMKMRRLAEIVFSEIDKIKTSTIQTCYCAAGNFDDGRVECKVSKGLSFGLL